MSVGTSTRKGSGFTGVGLAGAVTQQGIRML